MTKRRPFSNVFYGWWITWAFFVILTYSAGTFVYGTPAIVNPVREDLGWSVGAVALAFSLQRLQNGLLAPVVGQIVDRYGARGPIFFGTVLMSSSFIVLGFTSSLWMFYSGFLMGSVGLSFQSPSVGFSTVTHWFKRKRAQALSIVVAGGGFAGILVPAVAFLIDNLGWRHALFVMAGGFWIFSLPILLIIKPRPEPYGYQVDGGPPPQATPGAATTPAEDEPEVSFKQAMRSRSFWFLALGFACIQLSITPVLALSFAALEDKGYSRNVIGWVIVAFTLVSVCARFFIGWLADRANKRYIYTACAVLQITGLFCFVAIGSAWTLVPFIVTFGAGYGGTLPLRPAMQVDYFGRKSFGAINGMILTVLSPAAVASPAIVGLLHNATDSYAPGFILLAGVSGLGIPLVLLSKPKKTQNASQATA